jgi:hypothetical protein
MIIDDGGGDDDNDYVSMYTYNASLVFVLFVYDHFMKGTNNQP